MHEMRYTIVLAWWNDGVARLNRVAAAHVSSFILCTRRAFTFGYAAPSSRVHLIVSAVIFFVQCFTSTVSSSRRRRRHPLCDKF